MSKIIKGPHVLVGAQAISLSFAVPAGGPKGAKDENSAFSRVQALPQKDEYGEKVLRRAREEGKKLVEDAKEETRRLLEAAEKEAAALLAKAREEGFALGQSLGLDEAREKSREALCELAAFFDSMRRESDRMLTAQADEITELAIRIARKIIGAELGQDNAVLLQLFREAAREMREEEWVRVSVADAQADFAAANADFLLSMVKGAKYIEVTPLPGAPAGTCVIETEEGLVDASLETQFGNIRLAFENAHAVERLKTENESAEGV